MAKSFGALRVQAGAVGLTVKRTQEYGPMWQRGERIQITANAKGRRLGVGRINIVARDVKAASRLLRAATVRRRVTDSFGDFVGFEQVPLLSTFARTY
jgi:hypothetical protein